MFQRLGAPSSDPKNKVCYHWRAGKCNRYPCPFLHRELPSPPTQPLNGTSSSKRPNAFAADDSLVPRRAPTTSTWGRAHGGRGGNRVVKKLEKICHYWVQGNCSYGETCKYLHSWCLGDGLSLLSQLDGHQKVIPIFGYPFFFGYKWKTSFSSLLCFMLWWLMGFVVIFVIACQRDCAAVWF